MWRSVSKFAKVAVLACVGWLVVAQTCEAQIGFYYGNRSGGSRWGLSIGTPYYGGYGYRPWVGGGGVWGGNYLYSPYAYGGYYPYSYSSYPSYYGYGPTNYYPQPSTTYVVPGTSSQYSLYPPGNSSQNLYPNSSASIEVHVPPDAELWFDGTKTQQTGAVRQFVTPSLPEGKTSEYEVRATWTDPEGKQVVRTRQVQVSPNQQTILNLMNDDRQDMKQDQNLKKDPDSIKKG
jgi:uncharacterized protein (TIGR03000 family)